MHLAIKHGIDPGEVLQKAMIHDIDEVVTGDIPTPTKYDNVGILGEIRKLERKAAGDICNRVFDGNTFKLWDDAKDYKTDSGNIIAIADLAAVVYKIQQEVNRGNKSFILFIENIRDALMICRELSSSLYIDDIDELITTVEDIK